MFLLVQESTGTLKVNYSKMLVPINQSVYDVVPPKVRIPVLEPC